MFSLPFQYIPHQPQLFALLAYSHRLSTTFLSPPPFCNKVWLFYPLLQTHGAKDCNYFFLIHFLLLEKKIFFPITSPQWREYHMDHDNNWLNKVWRTDSNWAKACKLKNWHWDTSVSGNSKALTARSWGVYAAPEAAVSQNHMKSKIVRAEEPLWRPSWEY